MKKQRNTTSTHYVSVLIVLLIIGFFTLSVSTFAQKSSTEKDDSSQKELQQNIANCIWDRKLDELKKMVEKDKSLADLKLKNEETPLTIASYAGYLDMVKYLLTKGVNIESKNKWNNNALMNAALTGYVEIGKLLIEHGANIEVHGSENYTPLQTALAYNNPDFALMLLNNGAKVKTTDFIDQPPIILASWYGNPQIIKTLVEKGSDINYAASDNNSVLHNVCSNGNIESIDYLIQKGANVNLVNADGELPLHIVTTQNNSDAVKLLVKKTTTLNLKNKNFGNTALLLAAINGDLKSTQYLIEAGADANITNNEGLKPVECAAKYGYVKLADYYSSKNAAYNTMVKQAKMTIASVNENPVSGQIKIWYTGHSGWALQFNNKVVIIDYWQQGGKNNEPSLSNGNITVNELKGKKVYVFVTHNHSDHYDTTIFNWQKEIKDIKYVYGFQPEKILNNNDKPYNGPLYKYFDDNQTGMVDDIKVTTIKSSDTGQGFLLEVNGLKIFHPGDHALFNEEIAADYKKEIDFIAQQNNNIDIAFLPVTGCPSSWKKENIVNGFFYAIDKLNPREVYPMHAFQREFALKEFAEIAKQKKYNNKIICVENKGDHYPYNKSVLANKE